MLCKRQSLSQRIRHILIRMNFAHLDVPRSEEHTSELQSLRRISYAVFCLLFFNDTATTEIYTGEDTLSLHDALPICKIHTDENVSDPLTKTLSLAKHVKHREAMGVRLL